MSGGTIALTEPVQLRARSAVLAAASPYIAPYKGSCSWSLQRRKGNPVDLRPITRSEFARRNPYRTPTPV